MFTKRFVATVATVLSLGLLAGCGGSQPAPATDAKKDAAPAAQTAKPVTLKVGVTAGPHEQIVREVAKSLTKENITLDIKVFTDYKIPNQALQNKELDLNVFQHQPYLDKENKERNFNLVTVGKAVTFPMGVYSKKIQKLDQLKEGAKIAIPNDATNGGRALLIFQQAGLIKLKPEAGIAASARDIIENPKKLKFEELEAALLPRVLPDVDLAAVNGNYAMDAGLDFKNAVYVEQNSPYVNIIAARPDNKDQAEIQKFVKAYNTPEIKKFIEDTFKGSVVAGW